MKIQIKPIQRDDFPFLKMVYRSTRKDEMEKTDWSEKVKSNFIEFQFNAQHSYYTTTFKNADFNIVLLNTKRIGRLYTWETKEEIRIVDISLLPEFQGKGIGTLLLNQLINESEQKKKKITLHVSFNNPALSFYERLNFIRADYTEPNYYMERIPATTPTKT